MDPELFTDPVVQHAYAVAQELRSSLPAALLLPLRPQPGAQKSPGLLRQQARFRMRNGIYEDFYAFEQSGKGKSAAQIRAGIVKGEWKSVDASQV